MTPIAGAILDGVPEREIEEAPDGVLDALWGKVQERWHDEALHAAVLEHAVRVQRLPELAGRYRALAEDPERSVIARKRLDAIVVTATNMLWSMKTPEPTRVPLSITLSAFGICLFLLALLGWAMWGRR